MILSVVIISYNVKFFLEQCLSSLKKAVEGSDMLRGQTEVFIVDNASSDGSMDFLIPLFPVFRFIRNKENSGFARANNQVISFCTGEYILFLNPDTILAEDSLENCIRFFRNKDGAGAIGVKMVDGSGSYLRESKRGFPGAWASFYKMSGMSALFPHSKKFAAYYMGHLSEENSHAVDILSGAFLMVKKSVLDRIGVFDEQFFMYGEDIDLSWRIIKAGFTNYYFADTTIIHFKGESTTKDARYVSLFYSAMELFMKKHFRKNGFSFQLFFLKTGIRIRRALTLLILPFRVKLKPTYVYPTYIQGDPLLMNKWRIALTNKDIIITENIKQAEQIIYCEGVAESWKSIITDIQVKNDVFYKFHGNNTHAAVGSFKNRNEGKVLEL